MTKMDAMPIYGKTLKNLLLRNQKANDLETWYTALSTGVLLTLFKLCPWVDPDLLYSKVKLGFLIFCMEVNGFFQKLW